VLVYIGEEDYDSNEVMELISQNPRNLSEGVNLLADDRWILAWRAMTGFVQRPYFSRCWVVQETALAQEIKLICGTLMCEWDSFIFIIQALLGETLAYSVNKERSQEHLWDWGEIRSETGIFPIIGILPGIGERCSS
jgi:hypothetical protein